MNAKAIIFDLDGTLVESLPGITNALNLTLEGLGLPTQPESQVRGYIGDGLWMLLRRAFDPAQYDDAFIHGIQPTFKAHYQSVWKAGTLPFDGIPELIEALNKTGIIIGVLSNKIHPATVEIVEALFGREQIPIIYGQRDEVPKKPDAAGLSLICDELKLSPQEVFFVGDSTIDLETAKNAGTQGIGVTWGYHDKEDLEPYGYTLCESVQELGQYLL